MTAAVALSREEEAAVEAHAARGAEKAERLRARAGSKATEAGARFAASHAIGDRVPMGQPILVGHHSEGRHRRDIARMDGHMRAGVDAAKEATELERRAGKAETRAPISSDEPEAVTLLRVKLRQCEADKIAFVADMKRARVILRALVGPDGVHPPRMVAIAALSTASPPLHARIPDFFRHMGDLPRHRNGLDSAEIKRVKERIAQLEKKALTPVRSWTVGDVTIDTEENRVRLHFPGKPSDAVRADLKRSGFRWSPTAGTWQSYQNAWQEKEAERIARAASVEVTP